MFRAGTSWGIADTNGHKRDADMTQDSELYAQALDRFRELFALAQQSDTREPTAMTLATADAEGRPAARTVLLKQFDERGFVFFTSLNSRKGKELKHNPRAALCFFWEALKQQVLVEGSVNVISDEEADRYWGSRSRDSQLGAWASQQSEPLDSRQALEQRLGEYHEKFQQERVPRPPYWSGFRVVPERIEFWKSGWHRLHERICYTKTADGWSVTLLNP